MLRTTTVLSSLIAISASLTLAGGALAISHNAILQGAVDGAKGAADAKVEDA